MADQITSWIEELNTPGGHVLILSVLFLATLVASHFKIASADSATQWIGGALAMRINATREQK